MPLTRYDHNLRIEPAEAIGERAGLLIIFVLVPVILALDIVSPRSFSLQVFYILPIALGAWVLGDRMGYGLALFTGLSCAFVAIGTRAPGDGALATVWEIGSTFALFLFVAYLVARQRRYVHTVRVHARLEAESGALSRREFDRLLEEEVRRARRYRRTLALIVFDIGDVKGRKHSHFPAIVRAMRPLLREGDCVARLTLRRFALLLVERHSNEALETADALRAVLAGVPGQDAHPVAVGFATYGGTQPTSGEDLLRLAERDTNLSRSGSSLEETHVA